MKEWNQRMKELGMITYLLSEKDSIYVILPPSTTIAKYPIRDPWGGTT